MDKQMGGGRRKGRRVEERETETEIYYLEENRGVLFNVTLSCLPGLS